MIEVKDLSFSYYRKREILKKINIRFDKGLIGILGPNGCGKSTFMKILSGIIKDFEGEVYIFSNNMKLLNRKEISKLVAYLPQNMSYDPNMSVIEALISSKSKDFFFEPSLSQKKAISDAIEVFNLKEIKDKKLSQISGGELQRVFISMCFLRDTKIYIFDEPLNNLDIKYQLEIMKIIKDLSKEKIVLVVFHEINIALNFCDKIVFIKNGSLKNVLSPKDVNSYIMKDIFDVDFKIIDFEDKKIICFGEA